MTSVTLPSLDAHSIELIMNYDPCDDREQIMLRRNYSYGQARHKLFDDVVSRDYHFARAYHQSDAGTAGISDVLSANTPTCSHWLLSTIYYGMTRNIQCVLD